MAGRSSRISPIRFSEAVPRCIRFTTQPSAIMGHTSMLMYVLNMTKLPIEILCSSTCRPPAQSTVKNVNPISPSSSGSNDPCRRASFKFCAM